MRNENLIHNSENRSGYDKVYQITEDTSLQEHGDKKRIRVKKDDFIYLVKDFKNNGIPFAVVKVMNFAETPNHHKRYILPKRFLKKYDTRELEAMSKIEGAPKKEVDFKNYYPIIGAGLGFGAGIYIAGKLNLGLPNYVVGLGLGVLSYYAILNYQGKTIGSIQKNVKVS